MNSTLNKKISSIKEVVDKYSTFFFDLTGVVVSIHIFIQFTLHIISIIVE